MITHQDIRMHLHRELTPEEIRAKAPSVFAIQPMPGVTSRYAFVPTARLVDQLRDGGWFPVSAAEGRVRLPARRGFQRHLLTFQRRGVVPVQGEYTAELCLINSHDRSCAYELHAGLFRFVCSNGMHVSDDTFERMKIRHAGFTPDEVLAASVRITEEIPAIVSKVEALRTRLLSHAEQSVFAQAALRLRYDLGKAPIRPEQLLEARRYEDAGEDLWRILNRVGENLLRGGQRDHTRHAPDGRRLRAMRPITGLDRGIELNRNLWSLAVRAADGQSLAE